MSPLTRASTFFFLLTSLLLSSCSSLSTVPKTALPTTVIVSEESSWFVLLPTGPQSETGLVFYPGGLVKPEAYLPVLALLAERGYPVVLVKMPFDLAFFDAEKGLPARAAVPGVRRWVIGGHSLGGVAAAIAVSKHPTAFAGIALWASYPAKENSLAALSLPTLSLSASNDGLATPTKVGAAAAYLPPNTTRVVIEGGNHGQFGSYGPQRGDGIATISDDQQHRAIAVATLSLLAQVDSP